MLSPRSSESCSSPTSACGSDPGARPAPRFAELLGELPVLARVWRGGSVESQHRGSWVLVDADGAVLGGKGPVDSPVFARSSVKSLQALPLLESGAAERFDLSQEELALALASHNAEPCHTRIVQGFLARMGLGVEHLRCGPQRPGDPEARANLDANDEPCTALHNNCSGKHAGFLALALHLGVAPERYLDPQSAGQLLVRKAVADMAGLREDELEWAVDGCSAPTVRLPLRALATAITRIANPERLAPARRAACDRITAAAAAHPVLVAGKHRRLCTDILRASGGRLFAKIGAEAVYVIGVRGAQRGIAVKIEDGGTRALPSIVLGILERTGLARPEELEELASWREAALRNRAGLVVGHMDVDL